MLRLTLACLLLVGGACSKTKKVDKECPDGTDSRTGACVATTDPNAAAIAALTARLDAQTEQIKQMIAADQAKAAEIQKLRDQLKDPNTTQSQKEQIIRELGALGIQVTVAAAAKGGQALLDWLDSVLGKTPPPTSPQPAPNSAPGTP